MKPPDFLRLTAYFANCQKVSWKYFENEGVEDTFLRLTLERSQILKSQLSRKRSRSGIFCNEVLFDAFYHNHHFLDGNCAPNVILS